MCILWLFSEEVFLKKVQENRIWFGASGNGVPRIKRFLCELKKEGVTPMTIWKYTEVGHSQDASQQLKKLFDDNHCFDYPKSVELIKRCIELYSDSDCYIMDFFSGSATTAHAVMQLNAERGGNRKFIMVQLPEDLDERMDTVESKEKKRILGQIDFLDSINKPHTICEIGKERIRRAGQKILSENEGKEGIENLDIGFRVLKLDDTNMKDVYYAPQEYTQDALFNLAENVKEDRTGLDLLFGCLLEWGLPLSMPYSSDIVDGYTIHNYNNGDLIACFDKAIPEHVIRYMAKLQPLRVVFRDNSFIDSPAKINVGEIFKSLAPDTRIKVI